MDRRKQRMQGFFGWVDDGKTPTIVCARSAERTPQEVADGVSLTLREVRVYHFGRGGEVTSVSAGSLFYDLTSEVLRSTGYKRKAASTSELLESGTTKDMAEFQWRLSRGLSTGLLGLLAIRLGWGRRRRDRYGRLILAIACYVAYYLLSLAARAWVEGGRVPFVPGLWWVDIGLGVLLLAPRMGRRRRSS
jgi:lipopolysaccharide export system permease protein